MECLLPYLCMYGDCTLYNVELERMSGVGLARFHCMTMNIVKWP